MQETSRQSGYGLMDLVGGILDDARVLMRQEAQLFKDEVKLELSKAGRAASGFGVGALFLLLMLVHGLNEWFEWPLWVCYGLVGAAVTGSGIALIVRARSLVDSVHTTPLRSLHTMKENVQWIKERMTLKRT